MAVAEALVILQVAQLLGASKGYPTQAPYSFVGVANEYGFLSLQLQRVAGGDLE